MNPTCVLVVEAWSKQEICSSRACPSTKKQRRTLQNRILLTEYGRIYYSCRNSSNWGLLRLSKQPCHECWVCFKPLFDVRCSGLIYQCSSFTSLLDDFKQGFQAILSILFTVFKPESKRSYIWCSKTDCELLKVKCDRLLQLHD